VIISACGTGSVEEIDDDEFDILREGDGEALVRESRAGTT